MSATLTQNSSTAAGESTAPAAAPTAGATSPRAAPIKLRHYQEETVAAMLDAAQKARRAGDGWDAERCLVSAPTGSGKTLVFLEAERRVRKQWDWRTLVVVPSRELVTQTSERALALTPGMPVGRIGDGVWECEEEHRLVVATAASLRGVRLEKLRRDQFQLMIIDEAHHAASRGYQETMMYFAKAKLQCGFTATYLRGDGKSVASAEVFSTIIAHYTIGQMTDWKYLVPAKGYYVHTPEPLDLKVSEGADDFDQDELAERVNTPLRNGIAVDGWLKYANGLQTLCFGVNVNHAKGLAEAFRERGVRAECVWGQMPKKDYRRIMAEFKAGQIQVLTNAILLTEGFDHPPVECVLIARPASRAASYVLGPQMVGRALRPSPETGKTHAIIIEVKDGPPKKKKKDPEAEEEAQAQSLIAAAMGMDELDILEEPELSLHEQARSALEKAQERERAKLREGLTDEQLVDEMFDVIERLAVISSYAWVPLGKDLYMALAGGDFIEVVEEKSGKYEVRVAVGHDLQFIGAATSRVRAVELADAWLDAHGVNHYLNNRQAGWRKDPPTSPQVGTAHKLTGLDRDFLWGLNRGQISDLITTARALLKAPQGVKPL